MGYEFAVLRRVSFRSFVPAVSFLTLACGGPPPPTAPAGSAAATQAAAVATASASPKDTGAHETSPATAAPTEIESAALASHRGAEIATSLAEEVGPRLAGSPGDKLAVDWALKKMNELGFANVHAEPVTVPVWKRGVETAEIVAPVRQSLAITALGWSGATPKSGVTGELVEVTTIDQLKALPKEQIKGKIVFGNFVMQKTADGKGYGDAVPMRFMGPKLALEGGALAFVMRTTGTAEDRAPHTGATAFREEKKPIAAGALATVDAELLHDTLARDPHTKLTVVITPTRGPDAQSANVVGDVPGDDMKDQIVLMGAHLDSWDLARGAIDDGAGCAIVLEAGGLVALHGRPHRTVRVVLFAAEENSGAGGKAYLAAHASEVAKHVLAIEADSGTDRVLTSRYFGDPAKRAEYDALVKSFAALHIEPKDGDGHPGSDVTPLVDAGVPTIELRQDMSHYFDVHHSANDTQAEIHGDGIAQSAAAYAETAWHVANMPGDFGRASKRKDEFH